MGREHVLQRGAMSMDNNFLANTNGILGEIALINVADMDAISKSAGFKYG